MALWPFRRKSARKRSRSGASAIAEPEGLPRRSQTDNAINRAASKKKPRSEPAKLQRRQRAYSFSPGRHDSIRVDRSNISHGALAGAERSGRSGHPAMAGETIWERTPTLYHKRGDQHPTRRKSSKRRREDHEREAEIKAMSHFMPTRPAADTWTAGRPTKQSSKRTKTMGFGQLNHPMSESSLPLNSLHSSVSSDSDFVSFKVSALDVLAPRPTLRYAPGARWTPPRNSASARPASQGKQVAERAVVSEEAVDERLRIDDLVDDLDARELRELMERDNRRRERKKQHDQEKMERRLARRAEKQKAEAAEARKSGSPPPENLERGVVGRELVGLGIDPTSAVVTSSRKRRSGGSGPMSDVEDDTIAKEPLASFHRTDTIPLDEPEEPQAPQIKQPEPEEAVSALPQGSKLGGLLRSKKSRSKSTLGSDKEKNMIGEDEASRKDSEASNKAARLSLTSFLRWGGRNRRNSGPSSFSNTSREEMQAASQAQHPAQAQSTAQAQAQALAKLQGEEVVPTTETYTGNYMASKLKTGVPKRTRSRFREDLPDFPLSPPDSRVQSPDAEPPLPAVAEVRQISEESRQTQPINIARGPRQSPSIDRPYGSPSPDPHQSMSLASIDSEGSWLSGRVNSQRASTIRDSIARANLRERAIDSPDNSTQEDLAVGDDEYLSRLTPTRDSTNFTVGRLSEEGRPSSEYERTAAEDDVKWGAVGARPEVVHSHQHDRRKMQSYQGLVNIDSGDDSSPSPISASEAEQADLQRATSVKVSRHHARNFSAGSAKLLDVTPRVSVDARDEEARQH